MRKPLLLLFLAVLIAPLARENKSATARRLLSLAIPVRYAGLIDQVR
jgi:hypothetical protein